MMWDIDLDQIWREVWTEMQVRYTWPRHITTRWTTSPRGKSLPLPLPRSWLAGGRTTDPHHHLTDRLTEMHRLALPAALTAAALAGLIVGTTLPADTQGVEPPTPTTITLPAALTVALTEDDPRWNCETQGNLICGLTPLDAATAWDTWDGYGGAEQLIVNPHAKVALTGYTRSDPYAPGTHVKLATNQLALAGDGLWYIFTATN